MCGIRSFSICIKMWYTDVMVIGDEVSKAAPDIMKKF